MKPETKEQLGKNLKKTKEFLLSPFTEISTLLVGLPQKEMEKREEIKRIVYSYKVPLSDESQWMPSKSGREIFESISVQSVQVETEDNEEVGKIEVAMNVAVAGDSNKPIKLYTYPIYLAFAYILILFAISASLAHFLSLSMNYMVYIFAAEWMLLMAVIYTILSQRYKVCVILSKETFTRTQLLRWLQQNNRGFVDIDLIRENKEQLKELIDGE